MKAPAAHDEAPDVDARRKGRAVEARLVLPGTRAVSLDREAALPYSFGCLTAPEVTMHGFLTTRLEVADRARGAGVFVQTQPVTLAR